MDNKSLPNFMLLTGTGPDGRELIVNLNQISVIDQISTNGMRLVFGPATVNLTGPAVKDVITLLSDNCIVTDGTPLPELMERVRSLSQKSEQSQDPSPGA